MTHREIAETLTQKKMRRLPFNCFENCKTNNCVDPFMLSRKQCCSSFVPAPSFERHYNNYGSSCLCMGSNFYDWYPCPQFVYTGICWSSPASRANAKQDQQHFQWHQWENHREERQRNKNNSINHNSTRTGCRWGVLDCPQNNLSSCCQPMVFNIWANPKHHYNYGLGLILCVCNFPCLFFVPAICLDKNCHIVKSLLPTPNENWWHE